MSDSSTLFDADAIATAAPELRIGGRVFVGQILSIVEWSGFLERFLTTTEREIAEYREQEVIATATMRASHEFCVEYLRAVFPLRRFRPDPVAQLEGQGSRVVKEAFARFFAHQCYVMGVALRTPTAAATPQTDTPSPAPGNTSSGRTAPASDAGAPS